VGGESGGRERGRGQVDVVGGRGDEGEEEGRVTAVGEVGVVVEGGG